MTPHTHDPITFSVIQAGLTAAADEMFAVLKKTAMSPIIYEVLDVGTGITDARGELVSSGAGIPTFVGVLDKAVKRILEIEGASNVREGDLFVTNDPSYGGVTHLNDVVIAMPVFAQSELVAWTASIAHWNDIGGMTPGSMSTTASEIFQEGLRLPHGAPVRRGRIVAAGVRHHHGQFALAGFRPRRSLGAGGCQPQGCIPCGATGGDLWPRHFQDSA
ncbi:hydantoinase B/oxoprolinase family protein [Hoeflea alexandrii]|uniref:hydantoinase B/oxoprolinase family protein n=1 Tax=Hoeflea alexandrii TaxID=288436 RepID=UPI003CCDE8D5